MTVDPTPDVIFPGDPANFTGSFPLPSQAQTVTFTSNGTWTKPDGAQSVTVTLIGQGAGGGSGRRGAPGTIRNGGCGGSGAGWVWSTYPAAALPATVPVSVNDPGTGGGGGGSTGTTITDSFNRSNSTTTLGNADTGQTWTALFGVPWGISSNQAYNSGDTSSSMVLQNVGSADVSASVVVTVTSASDATLVIRAAADGSSYLFYNSALGTVNRYGYGSTPTLTYASGKSSSDLMIVAGDTIGLSASGSTVTVSKNGATICTFTDTGTGTYAGLKASSNTPRFDNFSASSATTVAPTSGPGVGGAAVTTDNTNGNSGGLGSDSTFGPYLRAGGGGSGPGGTAGASGASPGSAATLVPAGAGGQSASTGGAGSNSPGATGICGGGAGGGLTTGNVGSAGGGGNFPALLTPSGSAFQATFGGGQSGYAPVDGQSGGTLTAGVPLPGVAGGGGQSQPAAAGGNGGNGGSYGAPGGGGAASANGYASGKGGDGGPGIAVITTYF